MRLPKSFTTVTPLSKTIALSMFIIFPILAFYLGMYYQNLVDASKPPHVLVEYKVVKPIPPVSNSNIPNGTTVCKTNNDCPAGYTCVQAGPIISDPALRHRTCWKSGSPIPL